VATQMRRRLKGYNMYYAMQTLRHKENNELVRLVPTPYDTGWKWDWSLGANTLVVDELGNKLQIDINDYTCIKDEFGTARGDRPNKGQFVAECLKKYLVSKFELMKMRKKSLLEHERNILDRMAGINCKGIDIPTKQVLHPFKSRLVHKFFLRRRKAIPLVKTWRKAFGSAEKEGFHINHTTWVFLHTDGQLWRWDNNASLCVIDIQQIKKVAKMLG